MLLSRPSRRPARLGLGRPGGQWLLWQGRLLRLQRLEPPRSWCQVQWLLCVTDGMASMAQECISDRGAGEVWDGIRWLQACVPSHCVWPGPTVLGILGTLPYSPSSLLREMMMNLSCRSLGYLPTGRRPESRLRTQRAHLPRSPHMSRQRPDSWAGRAAARLTRQERVLTGTGPTSHLLHISHSGDEC